MPLKQRNQTNRSIWFIDGTLTDTTISIRNLPGNNAIEEYTTLPRYKQQEALHQMHFSALPTGYSQRVPNRAVKNSSSCRTASTDLSDPLSPLVPSVHLSREVWKATSYISTELVYGGSSWSSKLFPCEGVH